MADGDSAELRAVKDEITAAGFLDRLDTLRRTASDRPARGPGGVKVPMREIFALAKDFIDLPIREIEVLLDQERHDARVGAVSVMDWRARRTSTTDEQRRELYDLYVRRHDRIDNWDLVDRSAPHVVGRYLADKPREQLYAFARSASQWERRTAIVATHHFIREGDLDDTFAVAEILVHDAAPLIRKAVGGWIREAGKRDRARLEAFLDRYAATMPRDMLRLAVEHLDPADRRHYMELRSASAREPRAATVADAAEVARLLHDFNSEFDTPSPGTQVLAARLRRLLDEDRTIAILAGMPAVAVALITLRPNVWYDGQVALLDELYVVPHLRGQGIGSAVIERLVAISRGRGVDLIEINVDESDVDAQRFYERHGFTPTEAGSTERSFYYSRELPT